jgi:hypothetical protein
MRRLTPATATHSTNCTMLAVSVEEALDSRASVVLRACERAARREAPLAPRAPPPPPAAAAAAEARARALVAALAASPGGALAVAATALVPQDTSS